MFETSVDAVMREWRVLHEKPDQPQCTVSILRELQSLAHELHERPGVLAASLGELETSTLRIGDELARPYLIRDAYGEALDGACMKDARKYLDSCIDVVLSEFYASCKLDTIVPHVGAIEVASVEEMEKYGPNIMARRIGMLVTSAVDIKPEEPAIIRTRTRMKHALERSTHCQSL